MQTLLITVVGSMSLAFASDARLSQNAPLAKEAARPIVEARPAVASIPPAARPHTVVVAVDRARLERFARDGGGVLAGVPLSPTHTANLALTPVDPLASDARLEIVGTDEKGAPVVREGRVSGAFLAGSVAGVEGTHAFLASSDAGTFGYVEYPDRTFIITSGPFGSGFPTVSYDLTSMPAGVVDGPAWTCDAPPPKEAPVQPEGGIAGTPACTQIRVAYETDFEFLNLFQGNTAAANGYIATLASALTSIYTRDVNSRLSVSYIRLWQSTSDPWTQSSTSSQLSQFITHWGQFMQSVPRELAHFLSGRPLGGGIAYLPGLCDGYPYGLSANLAGFFPTPLVDNSGQNWDIIVVAHEIGHNFGAPHTHNYSPPIDGCGLSPADCTVANQDNGTIMSYCHLCTGGVQNIKLVFHPGNIATMESHLAAIPCNYTGPARAPVVIADTAQASTGTPVTIDVLANDLPFNCEGVIIELFSAASANGGVVTRSVGTGPGGRDQLTYTISNAFGGADTFTYRIKDTSNQYTTGTVTVNVTALRIPENPVNPSTQLDAAYFVLNSPTVLPNYATLTPYLTGQVAQLNYASSSAAFATSGRTDNVGAVFTGYLSVPTGGQWTLFSSSDEGSRVTIGNTVVVNNDGIHTMVEQSGTIGLAAGRHALKVEFFERTGSAGLIMSWQGPNQAKQVVPASAFFRGGLLTPADINNDGTVDTVDVALLLDAWGTAGPVGDLDGDGTVDAADLSALLNDWTN
ncbi:MAG: M12 family metallo-peptidase [Planctomycetota bacterium]